MGSFKPGSFGKKPGEKAMVEAITKKYGDLSQKGEPRFLEARMTSAVQDFIPVDTLKTRKSSMRGDHRSATVAVPPPVEDGKIGLPALIQSGRR